MRSFDYVRPTTLPEALRSHGSGAVSEPRSAYFAGGTTLLDLMKLDVMRPGRLVDLGGLGSIPKQIRVDGHGLHLGAFATMAAAAAHPDVIRDYPVVAQSLALAASAQIRNMASLGGNVLQRTRCSYFRDPSWTACNKRSPGSGCAAWDGLNRQHAVLGTSRHCIATYPGDWGQALIALEATVDIVGSQGMRTIRFADLHRVPASRPDVETTLVDGEIITGFFVPAGAYTRRSLYLKIRDRQSYEFAVASAAVALHLDDGIVRDVRIGLGGAASVPWRAHGAENAMRGRSIDEALAEKAAAIAFAEAETRVHNAFKVPLGRATLVRALMQVAAMEPDA